MTYDESDIFDPEHACEGCCDYRKNLRCCREVFDLMKRMDALEELLKAIMDKINRL